MAAASWTSRLLHRRKSGRSTVFFCRFFFHPVLSAGLFSYCNRGWCSNRRAVFQQIRVLLCGSARSTSRMKRETFSTSAGAAVFSASTCREGEANLLHRYDAELHVPNQIVQSVCHCAFLTQQITNNIFPLSGARCRLRTPASHSRILVVLLCLLRVDRCPSLMIGQTHSY